MTPSILEQSKEMTLLLSEGSQNGNKLKFATEVVCRRYEIGEGLYIGWSSALLALVGGVCLCCSCKVGGAEKE